MTILSLLLSQSRPANIGADRLRLNAGLLLSLALSVGCSAGVNQSSSTRPSTAPVVVSASQSQLRIGQTVALTATQSGVAVSDGTWQVVGGVSNGSVDATGLYQTPSVVPSPNQISVSDTVDGTAYPYSLTLLNPLPTLQSSTVSSLTATSMQVGFVGTGFTPGTVISVNNNPAVTSYISGTQVSAQINIAVGTLGSVSVTATNPAPGGATSAPLPLPVSLPTFTVSPATLTSGHLTLVVTGGPAWNGTQVVLVDGKEVQTNCPNGTYLVATGAYLAPWRTGTITVGIAPATGMAATEQITVPIAPTAVPYDTASRFATQAAFGPREDIIEHIQQVGLDSFITEQLQQPNLPYAPTTDCCGPRKVFLMNAVVGNSLLRARVSWALQTFLPVPSLVDQNIMEPWILKMETDATGNYRQVLEDAASDPLMGAFLNLPNNVGNANDPNLHPNQNFAREVMQLFSMGDVMLNQDGSVQLDSSGQPIPSYDDSTIVDLSRVFTGWEPPGATAQSNPNYVWAWCDYGGQLYAREYEHDNGQKVLFGNVVIPAGQTTAADRETALDAIFNHPNVPPFVSRRLIQRLVKSGPTPAYIARISAVFTDDGTGVRGNMAAIVRAILLDPEAREGDTAPTADDGFLQEPLMFDIYGMSILGMAAGFDGEPAAVPDALGEPWEMTQTIFGYYSPMYTIPATTINSPEFSIFNNLSLVQRSQVWWGMISHEGFYGFYRSPNYLNTTFTNLPDYVDALNHMLYHGRMSATEQATILAYCKGMDPNNTQAQFDAALFLAGNGDSYNVAH